MPKYTITNTLILAGCVLAAGSLLMPHSNSLSATYGLTIAAEQTADEKRVPRDNGNVPKTDRQIDMVSKLSMVQKIVEGISTEDYEMIEAGARQLVTLAESAAWKSVRDPYYRHYSGDFEQAAKGLIAAAKRGSIEKSTFAYVHVTFSCTACHQHVRGTIRTAR